VLTKINKTDCIFSNMVYKNNLRERERERERVTRCFGNINILPFLGKHASDNKTI
jgi:hypothetical protein